MKVDVYSLDNKVQGSIELSMEPLMESSMELVL